MAYVSAIVVCVCLLLTIHHTSGQDVHRNLTLEVTPGCELPRDACNVSVYYVKAVGLNDVVHYLWDFTGKPSLLLAYTEPNVTLEIDWQHFLSLNKTSGSIRFSSKPYYYFLFILDKLIEFDDVDDSGMLTKDSRNVTYDTGLFKWKPLTLLKVDEGRVQWEMRGQNMSTPNSSLTGSVNLQIAAFGDTDHDSALPRLLHSSNSSQVKITLNNLLSNSGFSQTRWALKIVLVSTDRRDASLEIESKKNLDDENSPGVFTIVNVMTPNSENRTGFGAFLQWRPVIYTNPEPSIANSSDVGVMNPSYVVDPEHALEGTLYSALLRDRENLIQSTIVSFGASQDGFYKKTQYSSWAFLISYGAPQKEGFSMLVILILAIGLGLPALLVIVGATFICIRRCSSREDELSLER